jgi:hypothetical protein
MNTDTKLECIDLCSSVFICGYGPDTDRQSSFHRAVVLSLHAVDARDVSG